MAMTSTVLTRVEDGVATLTLNRPKAMNAFDADDARAIVEATDLFAADPDVRVMVLGGAGRSFSAGGDFNWVLTWPDLDAITRRVGADAMMGAVQAIYDFPKPSIARVHGAAVGGGVGLMLACDFAVAAIGEVPFDGLRPDLWKRYLGIVLDGLRPGNTSKLRPAAPPRRLIEHPDGE